MLIQKNYAQKRKTLRDPIRGSRSISRGIQSVGWFLRGLNEMKMMMMMMIHERLTRVKQWMIEIVWDRDDDCFVDKIIQNCWI